MLSFPTILVLGRNAHFLSLGQDTCFGLSLDLICDSFGFELRFRLLPNLSRTGLIEFGTELDLPGAAFAVSFSNFGKRLLLVAG